MTINQASCHAQNSIEKPMKYTCARDFLSFPFLQFVVSMHVISLQHFVGIGEVSNVQCRPKVRTKGPTRPGVTHASSIGGAPRRIASACATSAWFEDAAAPRPPPPSQKFSSLSAATTGKVTELREYPIDPHGRQGGKRRAPTTQ